MDPSAGLDLRSEGGEGMSRGNARVAAETAACTSWNAASMLRSSRNCSVMRVWFWLLDDVIESSPEINENCFSRGAATDDAIVSASAPGRLALTSMVGKSTFGSSLTGREK